MDEDTAQDLILVVTLMHKLQKRKICPMKLTVNNTQKETDNTKSQPCVSVSCRFTGGSWWDSTK